MQGLGIHNMTSGNYLVCEFSHAGHAYLKQCPSCLIGIGLKVRKSSNGSPGRSY